MSVNDPAIPSKAILMDSMAESYSIPYTFNIGDSAEAYKLVPNIRFERTFDMKLVRQILTTPAIYRLTGEDNAIPIDEYEPPDHEVIWYVLAFDGDELLGCFCFYPEGSICWQVHTRLLPSAIMVRGRAVKVARGVVDWMWSNSPCLRITTRVPSFNRLALRLAQKASMVILGTNERSFMKYGTLYDQTLLGISKPGVL